MTFQNIKEQYYRELEKDFAAEEIELAFNLLIEKYLKKDQSKVKANPHQEINYDLQQKFDHVLERLKTHEPIQYILEEAVFFGRPFKVNSSVHVPRPESETMMNWVLEDFQSKSKSKSRLSLLDIGTGSGVLAISLAKEMPEAKVSAMDISEKALVVARENAKLNSAEVNFIQTDVLRLKTLSKKFDILVSNPPYVRKKEKRDVQRNFLDHEPPVALYVEDDDPMIFNRKIAELAKENLTKDGAVYVEINQYLAKETAQTFKEKGFKTEIRKDIFARDRTLKAYRES